MAEWGPKGRSAAHLSFVLDYGYMLFYGLFFALAGFAVRDTARALPSSIRRAGSLSGSERVSYSRADPHRLSRSTGHRIIGVSDGEALPTRRLATRCAPDHRRTPPRSRLCGAVASGEGDPDEGTVVIGCDRLGRLRHGHTIATARQLRRKGAQVVLHETAHPQARRGSCLNEYTTARALRLPSGSSR
jgi:hypothetical protein